VKLDLIPFDNDYGYKQDYTFENYFDNVWRLTRIVAPKREKRCLYMIPMQIDSQGMFVVIFGTS